MDKIYKYTNISKNYFILFTFVFAVVFFSIIFSIFPISQQNYLWFLLAGIICIAAFYVFSWQLYKNYLVVEITNGRIIKKLGIIKLMDIEVKNILQVGEGFFRGMSGHGGTKAGYLIKAGSNIYRFSFDLMPGDLILTLQNLNPQIEYQPLDLTITTNQQGFPTKKYSPLVREHRKKSLVKGAIIVVVFFALSFGLIAFLISR